MVIKVYLYVVRTTPRRLSGGWHLMRLVRRPGLRETPRGQRGGLKFVNHSFPVRYLALPDWPSESLVII